MPYKLVVADNSPSVVKAIQAAFPQTEYVIYSFSDGQELKQALSAIQPDAILLSLSLPARLGYELGLSLKAEESFKNIPLLLLRQAFDLLDEESLAGIDHDELVTEPFDSGKLERTVRDLIEKNRGPQTLPEDPFPAGDSELEAPEGGEEKVLSLVKKELSEAEARIEERIKIKLLAELKANLKKLGPNQKG